MKKFTIFNETINSNKELTENDILESILSKLTIELDSNTELDNNITIDYKIKATDAYFEKMKSYINDLILLEKKKLLEEMKYNMIINNSFWVENELEIISEKMKK